MRLALLCIAALVCLSTSACLVSRQGGVIFPSQTDLGLVTQSSGEHIDIGSRLGSRLSWASVRDDPDTKLDVGLGYQLDNFSGPAAPEQADRHGQWKGPSRLLHGPTLDASYRVQGTKTWRHWIGGRLEMPMRHVAGRTHAGIGVGVRMTAEFFRTASTQNLIGSMGIGAYVETGARLIPGGTRAMTTGAGLNVRLPLAAF